MLHAARSFSGNRALSIRLHVDYEHLVEPLNREIRKLDTTGRI
jgi:hypothetical protein